MNVDQNTLSEEFDRNENTTVSSNLLSEALGRALADEIVTDDIMEENNSGCITLQGSNFGFHTISLSSEEAMALGIKFADINTVVPSMSNQIINQEVQYTNFVKPEPHKSIEGSESSMGISGIGESELISYQVQKLNPVSMLFNSVKNGTDSNEQPTNSNLPVMFETINSLNQVQKVTNNVSPLQFKQQTGTLLKRNISNKQNGYYITQPNKKVKLDVLKPAAVNNKILSNIQLAPTKKFSYVNVNNNIANKPRTILPKQMIKLDSTLTNTSLVPLKKQSRVKSLLGGNIIDNSKPVQLQTNLGSKDFIKIKNGNSIKGQNNHQTAISSLVLRDKVKIFPVKIRTPVQNSNIQTSVTSKLIYTVNSVDSKNHVLEVPKNIIAKPSNVNEKKTLEDNGTNIVFNIDRNIVVNKTENSSKLFDNGVVEKKLYKMPVKNDKMPLGSTDNPFKLIQNGQNFHSVQTLNDHQLQQIAGFLKQRPSHQSTDGSREPHKVMLYDSATNKKIVYRVVYPEELDLKEDPKAGPESDSKSTRSRGRPKGKSKCPSPIPVEVTSSRPPARTRSGRVSRPPPRMVEDYKRLRPDDSDREGSPDNLDNMHSSDDTPDYHPHVPVNPSSLQQKTFDERSLLLGGLQKKERNIKSQYICPTCKKIYLGYTRMKRHLEVHPDHGEIEKLGLEPKGPVQKPLKKPFHCRGRGRHFLKQNTQSLEANTNQQKRSINENANINNPDLLSTLSLTEAKAKQSICDMTTEVNKHNEYISNILSYNKFSVFDLLMMKVNCVSEGNKMNTLCVELLDLIEKVKNVTNQSLLLTNSKAENVTRCEIPEEISRFLGIRTGCYDIDEAVFNSTIQEAAENTSFESGLDTPSSNSENLISTTFESATTDTPRLDNHRLENMDIDMTCVSNSEEFMNKNIPINILVSDHAITPIHSAVNRLMGSKQDQLQLDQPILQQSCDQIDAAISLEHNSMNISTTGLNILRSDISIHEDEYQNVDELVSERLKNLTADELAVPPLNASRSTLDATATQQLTCPDLPLDFLIRLD